MGAISLEVAASHRRGFLGSWLGSPYLGRSGASAAARAATQYGFTDTRTTAPDRDDLHAAQRRLRAAMDEGGVRHAGRLRDYDRKGEEYIDAATYALVREE